MRLIRNLIISFIICLPAVFPLFRSGFFTMYDDMQVIRLDQMDKCIKDGQIPCRWVPDLGYGYGYPLFQYYSPLPYYVMEIFRIAGISLIASVKIGFVLSVFFSSLFFLFLAKRYFSPLASIVSTLLYVYAPFRAADLYVRGAMGELWGMAMLPSVLLGAEYMFSKKNNKSVALFSLTLFLYLVTHNLTVFMTLPILIFWILLKLYKSKYKKSDVKRVFVSLCVGLLLASFYLVPVIIERELVYLESLTWGYFNYLAHFLNIKQLFLSVHWGYGPSELGMNDDVFLGLGPIHLITALGGMGILLFKKSKNEVIGLFLLAVLFVSLFLAHPRSTFIWNSFVPLEYLQFPWRFILVSVFASSFVSGFLFEKLSSGWKKLSLMIFAVFFVVLYGSFFHPKDWFLITDIEKLSGNYWDRQVTASIYDYLPKSAKNAPQAPAPGTAQITDGEATVDYSERGTNWYKYVINTQTEEASVVAPVFDFPVWQVTNYKKFINYERTGDLGLIGFKVPQGRSEINIQLKKSNVRKVGDLFSIIGFMILVYLLLSRKNKIYEEIS